MKKFLTIFIILFFLSILTTTVLAHDTSVDDFTLSYSCSGEDVYWHVTNGSHHLILFRLRINGDWTLSGPLPPDGEASIHPYIESEFAVLVVYTSVDSGASASSYSYSLTFTGCDDEQEVVAEQLPDCHLIIVTVQPDTHQLDGVYGVQWTINGTLIQNGSIPITTDMDYRTVEQEETGVIVSNQALSSLVTGTCFEDIGDLDAFLSQFTAHAVTEDGVTPVNGGWYQINEDVVEYRPQTQE